jgi:hypothetical protein
VEFFFVATTFFVLAYIASPWTFVRTNEGIFLVTPITSPMIQQTFHGSHGTDVVKDQVTIYLDRHNVIRKIESFNYSSYAGNTYVDDFKVVVDPRRVDANNFSRHDPVIEDLVEEFKNYCQIAARVTRRAALSHRRRLFYIVLITRLLSFTGLRDGAVIQRVGPYFCQTRNAGSSPARFTRAKEWD